MIETKKGVLMLLILCGIALAFGFAQGYEVGYLDSIQDYNRELVKRGIGEYYLDNNYNKPFRFKGK